MTDRISNALSPSTVSTPATAGHTDAPASPATRMQKPAASVTAARAQNAFMALGRTGYPFYSRAPGCSELIGWLAKEAPPGQDVTATFETLNASALSRKNVLPAHANDFVYLCIGGIFSDRVPRRYYLQENMDALRSAGLDVRRIQIDSLVGVETNARVVRDAVLSAAQGGKKVVLIGHSKGGLDSAAAIAMYPEVAAVTHALITMQSPYAGSPVAQDIADDPIQKKVTGFLLENVIRGNPDMARDLTYAQRRQFLTKHPLPKGVNVVSLATTDSDLLSLNSAPNDYIRLRYRKQSDGLVVPVDALLPDSRYVLLTGLDHLSTTCPSAQRSRYTPASITTALVAIALG